MIFVEIAGVVVLTVQAFFLQRRVERIFENRLAAQDATEEERRVALYKQQKATARAVAQSERAQRKLSDETRKAHEDTRLLQRRVDAHFSHPNIKRLTGQEDERAR